MAYAAQHPGAQDPTLKGMLPWSLALHGLLVAAIAAVTILHPRTESWGGATSGGSAVQVGMVRNLPGVPMPPPDAVTTSRVADDSKTLYKAEPKPKEAPPPPDAIKLSKFEREQLEKYKTKKSRLLEDKTVPPPNAVPGAQTGAPALPYSQSQTPGEFTVNGATQGAVAMSGAGNGDFGTKYPWFAEAVRNRISSNWLQSMVDPSIRTAPRAVLTFQILRDGTIANIQLIQSSGIASVDTCAKRAVLASSPVMKLPSDYYGSALNVQFYFDFKR
jgi:TonB family protein